MRLHPLHVDLVCRTTGTGVNGIRDHSVMLARALDDVDGVTATVHDLYAHQDERDLVRVTSNPAHSHHAVVLQYQAYSYGRWGWAPWLVAAVRRLRTASPGAAVVLLAHELFVELDGPRNVVVGLPQRAQFAALRSLSDVVLTTTEPFARRAGGFGRPPAGVLPVGSNLPDRRSARADARRALGVKGDQVVVGLLGTGHWSRMFDVLPPTIARLAKAHRGLVVTNLGAGAPVLQVGDANVVVHRPGELEADELAKRLSAVDVLLLPFTDGVSTRRTTLMAGLQHAIPVLSTDGPSTGELLRASSGVALVPLGDAHAAFASHAETLVGDVQRRLDLSRGGRELYERRFAWPVLAGQLLEHLDAAVANPRRTA